MNKILFVISLLLFAITNISAQTLTLPQSRFTSSLANNNRTFPSDDGFLHFRFEPGETEIVTQDIGGVATKRLKFTVQARVLSTTDIPMSYVVGFLRIDYSTDAFGDLLDPPLTRAGRVNPAGKCSVGRSAIFETEGTASYTLGIQATDNNTMLVEETSTAFSNPSAEAEAFGFLTNQFKPYITLTCTIVNDTMDANISINGSNASGNSIRRDYPDPQDFSAPAANQRSILPIADNDIRGFRLDGKTWVEDYVRYENGRGVRLKFSKGIRTELTKDHFSIESVSLDDSAISTVTHVVGTPYVEIDFNQVVGTNFDVNNIATDILRISTDTIVDMDGNNLADGNFAAALYYDAAAPKVTEIIPNEDGDEFTLTFSSAIAPNTVTKESLCVTEPNGICVAEETTPTVPILSVTTHGDMPTTLTVVVAQPERAKVGGTRSIEFRRNAVLGDFSITGPLRTVEDYQTVLRDALMLQDTIGPEITVARVTAGGNLASGNLTPSSGDYTMYFRVTADEDVPELSTTAAYQLEDSNGDLVNATAAIQTVVTQNRDVILQYTVEVGNTPANATYFTLARSSTNPADLQDASGNDPIIPGSIDDDNPTGIEIAAGAEITADASARAPRDTTAPSITVDMATVVPSNNGLTYNVTFELSSNEAIPNIGNESSYTVTRDGGSAPSGSARIVSVNANAATTGATVIYTAQFGNNQYNAVRPVRGWRLDFVSGELLDQDGNQARFPDAAARTAERDDDSPIITIEGNPTLTVVPGIGGNSTVTVSFVVASDEDVPTLDEAASYSLRRYSDRAGNNALSFSGETITVMGNDRQAMFTAVIPLSQSQLRETAAFGLNRALGDTRLLDTSGNPPNISPGFGIDDNKFALRETDGAVVTVVRVDNVPTDNDVEARPDDNNGNRYAIGFTITNTEHDTKPISDLADPNSYMILRRSGTSNTTDVTVMSSGVTDGVNSVVLNFNVTINNQDDTEMTNGFVLARANDPNALLDSNGNALRFGSVTPVTIGVGEAISSAGTAVARRDTTKPNLTVSPGEAETSDGNIYTVRFTVTPSEENVRGISTTTSYSLLVAEEENQVMTGFRTATSISPMSITENSGSQVVTYTVNIATLQAGRPVTFPYGLMLGRANDGLRDLSNNDPIQTATNGSRTNTEVANGQPLQSGQVVLLDRVSPSITVTANSIAPVPANPGRYTMSFTTTATEDVRNIGNASSYRLMRVETDDTWGAASLTASQDSVTVNDNEVGGLGTSATFTYTITFTGNVATRLANIRGTRGFTLALVSGPNQINLQDVATNLPVKSNGDNIYDTDGTTLLNDGIIAPISGGVIASSAVAARDTTGPALTVTSGNATPATPTTYTGSFNIAATENIRGINDEALYSLLRIPLVSGTTNPDNANAVVETDATITVTSGTNLSQSATINFTATLDNVAQARGTYGFTLARASDGLRDIWDNAVTVVSGQQNRLTAGNGAVANRDIASPRITITATTSATAVSLDIYEMDFTISSNEDVASIGDSASYQVVRVLNDNTTTTAINSSMEPIQINTANRNVTIPVRIDLSEVSRAQIMQTRGFTLLRANNSLIDSSGNLPVKRDGSTDIANNGIIGPITAGRIDDLALALREQAPPVITVTPEPGGAVVTSGQIRRYTGAFLVTSSEPTRGINMDDSYQLMRVLRNNNREIFTGESVDLSVQNDVRNVASESQVITFVAIFSDTTNVRTVIRDTLGFTLARSNDPNDLIDNAGNAAASPNAPLDTDSTAVAMINKDQPRFTVTANTGANPDPVNGNQYTAGFTVAADQNIVGIGSESSYVVLRSSTPTSLGLVPIDSSLYNIRRTSVGSVDGTTATFEITVTYTGIADTQGTAGFTLGLAGDGDECNLCDNRSNLPARSDGTTINEDMSIDDRPAAVAERDTVPPFINVISGITEGGADVAGGGWRLSFKMDGFSSDDIQGLDNPASYRILGKNFDGSYTILPSASNPYTFPSVTGRVPCSDTEVAAIQQFLETGLSNCRVITTRDTTRLDIPASQARNIESFVLGRAPGALRDRSNNDPVVANDSQTSPRIVGTGPDGDGRTVLPLDLIGYEFTLDRNSPSITVRPEDLSRRGNSISGAFAVSSSDIIDEIRNPSSYVLLRVATGGSTTTVINNAITGSGSGDARSATIRFSITDNTPNLAVNFQYTLGRLANLSDKAGNPLVYAGTTDMVSTNTRIDRSTTALADIPAEDTMNPIVTLEATTPQANPDENNELRFTGAFVVNSDEEIPAIGQSGSYQLLRVLSGNATTTTGIANVSFTFSNGTTSSVTINFAVTLAGITQVQATTGFTLEPTANFVDGGGNGPLNNEFIANADDDPTVAMREDDSPRLSALAQTGQQPTFASGPRVMTPAFRVNVESPVETIRGINQPNSYQILRLVGTADSQTVEPFNGTEVVSIGSSNADGQLVSVTVTFDNIQDARNTYGFALARRGNLRDLSGNDPLSTAADGTTGTAVELSSRIDLRDSAVWVRTDRTQPNITVVAQGPEGQEAQPVSSNPVVYTGSFRISSGDVIRNINSPSAYQLLRQTMGGSLSNIDATISVSNLAGTPSAGFTAATVAFRTTLTAPILRATGSSATAGFILANASTDISGLHDIAGNLPVTDNADSLSNTEASIAARDTTPPTITVVALGQGAMPARNNPLVYTGSFRVSSTPTEAIRNLNRPASYNLLLITNAGAIRPFSASSTTITVGATTFAPIGIPTAATVNFEASLSESIVTATGNDAIMGFTLASATSTGLDGLRDIASNEPVLFSERRLSNQSEAIAEIEMDAPVITVIAEGEEAQPDPDNPLVYRGTFVVTAPVDDPVRNLNDPAVYRLLRLTTAGVINGIASTLTISSFVESATPAYYTSATVMFETVLANTDQLENTAGFTLGENRVSGLGGLQDNAGNRPRNTPPLRRLDSADTAIARIQVTRIECAAFYRDIGQNELFFRVQSEDALNLAGLQLTQSGSSLAIDGPVEQIGTTPSTVENVSIIKATLANEITSNDDITVAYTLSEQDAFPANATCEASLTSNIDNDARVDIVDNNPFDATDLAVNTNVAATGPATPHNIERDTFYSRDVLVRSLIRESFTYVEAGMKKQFTTPMTANEYFGIEPNDNTEVFTIAFEAEDADCREILQASRDYNLSKVKLDEFCNIGNGTIDFLEQPIESFLSYVWADIENERLAGGNYTTYDIRILAEINFSGQSSYIYTKETTKTVVVSAYSDTLPIVIQSLIRSQSDEGRMFDDELLTFINPDPTNINSGILSGTYNVSEYRKHPQPGETITHWMSTTTGVWAPTEATLEPRQGGYNFGGDVLSAVGTDNHIDVRVARDGDSEPITRINQILLYDVAGPSPIRVNSMVADRDYYVIADVTTNESDVQAVVATQFIDGYTEIITTSTTIDRIQSAGHLIEQEDFEVIALSVEDNFTTTGTITVGWDSINSAQNVIATYLVTPTPPSNYAFSDSDGDRIHDAVDFAPGDNTRLQVAVGGVIQGNIDYLRAHNDGQPLYASDEVLIIAAGSNNRLDYSVANISTATAVGLELDDVEGGNTINTIATFGIRSVDYAYTQDDPQSDAVAEGGMAHVTFPIPAGILNEVQYISQYNSESERWGRFERGTNRGGFADTWYVIDRPSGEACPRDIQLYKNVHQATGDSDMGFTANTPRCIMLSITDGGPYDGGSMGQGVADDERGADGRINSLIGIGTQLNPPSPSFECAAIYPNIGQTELFFEIEGIPTGGTFEISGATIQDFSFVPVIKVTLREEITDRMLLVNYTTANGEVNATMCMASLTKDSDLDGVIDIADASPFDPTDATRNPDTTTQTQTTTLAEVNEWYSRDVVIRSLLRDEEFDFIEEVVNGEDIGGTFTGTFTAHMAMNWEAYFGINANANTQIFRIDSGSECDLILAAAKDNNLNAVNIDEFDSCDERVIDFATEPVTPSGSQRYVWADVRDGRLVASDYPDYNLKIVPEINFSGQPTYIFPEPTTRTVLISAYIGNDSNAPTPLVRVRAQSRLDGYDEDDIEVLRTVSQGTISYDYDITSHGEHPEPGETIVRWLAPARGTWAPTSTTLAVRSGGYNLRDINYAIGVDNHINVRVADPEDEEVTRIRQILLYENAQGGLERVTSVIAGTSYYVVADYDTNTSDGISADDIEVSEGLAENSPYTIISTATEVALMSVRTAGDLKGSYLDIIEIMTGSITDTGIITVGWDNIGAVEDIRATYLITGAEPSTYRIADSTEDLFTDGTMFTTTRTALPVAIGNEPLSDNHILTTHDGQLPVFFTHVGIAIAEARNAEVGVMGLHYSASNIKYDDISTDTRTLLQLQGRNDDLIESIATFGISDVAYGFNLNEDGLTEVIGGAVYVTFPITVDVSTSMADDNIRYLAKHNNRDDTPRWENFERDDGGNTWYAIERTNIGVACPTDIQVYINEHEPAGNQDMGFTASANNCIMLVIIDGDAYDASSLDSRVIDPVGITTAQIPEPEEPVEPVEPEEPAERRRGGGGGAVGISDALLLIGAITLLLIAIAGRRRKTPPI